MVEKDKNKGTFAKDIKNNNQNVIPDQQETTWKIKIPEEVLWDLEFRNGKKINRDERIIIFDNRDMTETAEEEEVRCYIERTNACSLKHEFDEEGNQILGKELIEQLRLEKNNLIPDDLELVKSYLRFKKPYHKNNRPKDPFDLDE